MKPKGIAANREQTSVIAVRHEEFDSSNVSLFQVYERVGLMITESRLPDLSLKGRKDGCHHPQSQPTHRMCSDDTDECVKVKRYRDTMINLCRNRIPLCIEVLLCPNCELQSEKETTPQGTVHDVKDTHSNSYVLLEQWTIQEVRVRGESRTQSVHDLCSAVVSHLCFSQLSAWLQLSHGVSPHHIFYRLTAPGEWFVHKFVMSPQTHTFPDAQLGRSAVRVTVANLPRTSMTPHEISMASRDKLFAIKDASPSIQTLRSAETNSSAKTSYSSQMGISLTPNERTHSRSKSVRGLDDLAEKNINSLGDEPHTPGHKPSRAQRCLNYDDQSEEDDSERFAQGIAQQLSPASNQLSAEKLASFTSLPTNHLDKLDLISCHTGSVPQAAPPNRLPFSPCHAMTLKSPKVLFTRTSVYNQHNFFPALPANPLDTSETASTTFESSADDSELDKERTDTNGAGMIPIFDIDLDKSEGQISPLETANNGADDVCASNVEGITRQAEQLVLNEVEVRQSVDETRHQKVMVRRENVVSYPKKATSEPMETPVRHHPAFLQFGRSKTFRQTPSQSSPAPVKKKGANSFGYDSDLNNSKAIKRRRRVTNAGVRLLTGSDDSSMVPTTQIGEML